MFQLAAKSGIIIVCGKRMQLAQTSRCMGGWLRVRDAGFDGLMSLGFGTNVIRCREPCGITMLAWTWNDRTNGREYQARYIDAGDSIDSMQRRSRMGVGEERLFGNALEEVRLSVSQVP